MEDLWLKKLNSSGLDYNDSQALVIECLTPQQTAALHPSFKPLACLKFNYFDVQGAPISDWPGGEPFYRVRFVEQPPIGFDDVSGAKPLRYMQPANTAPVAYYPKSCDWRRIIGDIEEPIIITEGELKAAKLCKEGFPTIGLGGVYSWRAIKLGIPWLPSLNFVRWSRRYVYICFDADFKTNPQVCRALAELADALHQRGAFVQLVVLPQLPGIEKTGVDDFLVAMEPHGNKRFHELLTEAIPLGLTEPLWMLNERYVYVRNPGLIINQKSHEKVAPGAFKEHLESTLTYQERSIRKDGSVSFKAVGGAGAWLCWPLRNEVFKLSYAPGKPTYLEADDARMTMFNTWPGWGVPPIEGDTEPFLTLVKHLFTDAEPAAMEWFLQWCAYPLKYPGVKLFSSVVIHGIKHGTGKSFIGYTLGKIYGKNFTEISQVDLHNHFNEWAEGKQFVMGDDVTGSNKRADADFLKKLITQKELRVNSKYIPTYTIPDCINYFFTANHPDSFFLEDDDRRFFIHEVTVRPLDEEFYLNYDLWLDSGGASAVFHYLLNLDLDDFNPAAPAYKTAARDRMIVNVQSDLAGWVRQLIATPDQVLRLGGLEVKRDLFTARELLSFYDPSGHTGTTANGVGRELARAGIRYVCNGRPLKLDDGSQNRYYIIRNISKWLNADSAVVVEYLNEHVKQLEQHKKY